MTDLLVRHIKCRFDTPPQSGPGSRTLFNDVEQFENTYSYRLHNRPPGVGNYSARVDPGGRLIMTQKTFKQLGRSVARSLDRSIAQLGLNKS